MFKRDKYEGTYCPRDLSRLYNCSCVCLMILDVVLTVVMYVLNHLFLSSLNRNLELRLKFLWCHCMCWCKILKIKCAGRPLTASGSIFSM